MSRSLKFREKPKADENRVCSLLAEAEATAYAVMHPEEGDLDVAVAAGVMAHTLIMVTEELTVDKPVEKGE